MMKIQFVMLVLGLCFGQCSRQELEPTPTELTTKLVNELRPQLVGTWQIRQAQINHKELVSVYYPTGISKDTVIQNLAVLTFWPSSSEPSDPRVLELEGSLQFRTKAYPIYAKLYPFTNAARPKGFVFIDYHFKEVNSDTNSPEVDYLRSIGLVGENFSIETGLGGSVMTWRGSNRALVTASLYKK